MTPLLDVNTLVALAWPNHVHHLAARAWFVAHHASGWVTCPVTESGFVRVSSNRRVIPDARTVAEAVVLLGALRAVDGHVFWTDDVSLTAVADIDLERVHGYRQVTDAHLLALAIRNGGTLVTFDRGVVDLAADHVTLLSL